MTTQYIEDVEEAIREYNRAIGQAKRDYGIAEVEASLACTAAMHEARVRKAERGKEIA